MASNIVFTFISFDYYILSNCWLIAFGVSLDGFLGLFEYVNFGLTCSCAESLNRVYQYFRYLFAHVMMEQ